MKHLIIFLILSGFIFPCNIKGISKDTGSILGKVVNYNNDPVIGGTVRVLGTTKGAKTKVDGSFKVVSLEYGDYKIKVSYVGCKDTILEVSVKPELDKYHEIKLEESDVKIICCFSTCNIVKREILNTPKEVEKKDSILNISYRIFDNNINFSEKVDVVNLVDPRGFMIHSEMNVTTVPLYLLKNRPVIVQIIKGDYLNNFYIYIK